jgi:beta-galactosidase
VSVQITQDGLQIDGKPVQLHSGSVQPWRLDPAKWGEILDRVVELGFKIIEVYIPWGAHELADGTCDFSGHRDIGAFLDLAHQRGLKAIVRPGPHANAEITGFGYPERILRDESMLARGPEGNPVFVPTPPRMFPIPSYAGDRLYREFEGYLKALAPVLKARLHPRGPIIAIQADNEMTLFFRTGAFDLDYCDAALAEYHQLLEDKYTTITKLNRAYNTKLKSFHQVQPPHRFEAESIKDLPPYLDWATFKEAHLQNSVMRIAGMFREYGLDSVPVTHNYPLGHLRSPLDLPGLEQGVDLVGMDMYYQKGDYATIKARCVALCGLSRHPYAPEFGSGSHFAWPPIDLPDHVFTTLSSTMHGLRGINFYMIVDRERWYGAPVRRDGSVDPERADVYKRFLAMAEKSRGASRTADVLLLTTRLYGRLENLTNIFDPLSPMALAGLGFDARSFCPPVDLGLKRPPAATHAGLQEALFSALSAARLSFDIGEPDRPGGNLKRYKMFVLPTLEILEHQATVDLLAAVRDGGTLVMGPDIPRLDETGRADRTFKSALSGKGEKIPRIPSAKLYHLGSGRIILLPKLTEDDTGLAKLLSAVSRLAKCRTLVDPQDPEIDSAEHPGNPGFVWLANPTGDERTAELKLKDAAKLTDRWSGEVFKGPERFSLPMPPHTVRPLEVGR